MFLVLKRVRVLLLAATIAFSLLAGATQAAAGTGSLATTAVKQPAPMLITASGVSWE